MHILIIEDDKVLASSVRQALLGEGFAADHVEDGLAGERRIELYHKDYDLIILDWMLPGKIGIDICGSVRAKGVVTPILMLTAKSDVSDKVSGLTSGADDYLTKPFALEELLARVKTLLRRPKGTLTMNLTAGDITLDPNTRRVFRKGKEVKLSLKEFAVLEYFMRNPNRAVSREELFSHVWDFANNSLSNVIDVHLYFLRKKLKQTNGTVLLETVPGIGYRMNRSARSS